MRAIQRLASLGAILGVLCVGAMACGDRYEANEPRGAVSGASATTTTTMGHRTAPPPPANP
jgi:hypothetical protein